MIFKESKKIGDKIEEEVLKIIKHKYPNAYTTKGFGKFSDYDIYIPEINEGIEVKGDYKSSETGNIIVEVEMYNKPSGLSITKAKYWVFVDGYRLIWLTPLDIYRFIELNNYKRTNLIGEGDTEPKYAYLLNHKKLVLYAYDVGLIMMIKKNSPIYYNNLNKK